MEKSVVSQENQIALLGETVAELEKQRRQLRDKCRRLDSVNTHLRRTIHTLEGAIIAEAQTNAELRDRIEEIRRCNEEVDHETERDQTVLHGN